MARRRTKSEGRQDRGLIFGLSPNQVVAYNLARARELKGWTQDQTAEALEPYLGVLWSKASLSQAERSVAGRVVRNFSADEIVAFARAFEVPVTWFFMPPPAWAGPGLPTRLDVPDAPALGETVALLVDLVFGDKAQQAMLAVRLDAFLGESGAGVLTAAQARITALGRHKVEALVRQSFQDLGRWQTSLRALANQLEDLEVQAKRAVAADAGIDADNLGVPAGGHDPEDEATLVDGPSEGDGETPNAKTPIRRTRG